MCDVIYYNLLQFEEKFVNFVMHSCRPIAFAVVCDFLLSRAACVAHFGLLTFLVIFQIITVATLPRGSSLTHVHTTLQLATALSQRLLTTLVCSTHTLTTTINAILG